MRKLNLGKTVQSDDEILTRCVRPLLDEASANPSNLL